VTVGVRVRVTVGVAVRVTVGVRVRVTVGVRVRVTVGVRVRVTVGVAVRVTVGVAVAPLSSNTATGTLRLSVVPSPTCPSLFRPQHFTTPACNTAHAWPPSRLPPTCSRTTPLVIPATCLDSVRFVVVPSPTCPALFLPQHRPDPPSVTTHVVESPAVTCSTPVASPLTATGSVQSLVVPSPTCPYVFRPQHFTAPPFVTAHT
jgi:hypothetical protein